MGKNKNKHSQMSAAERETHAVTQPSSPPPSEVQDGTLPQDPIAMLKELKRRESAVADRDRRLVEREIEADAGFAQKNNAALAALGAEKGALERQVADLRAQLAGTIERELADATTRRAKEYEVELESIRKLQRESLDREMQEKRTSIEQLLKQLREDCERWCSTQRQEIQKREQELAGRESCIQTFRTALEEDRKQWADTVSSKDVELTLRERKIQVDVQLLDAERRDLSKRISEAEARGTEQANRELRRRERLLAEAAGECERLQTKVDAQAKLERDSGHRDFGQVVAENARLHREHEQLKSTHSLCPAKDVDERLAATVKERDAYEEKATRLARENAEYKTKGVKWDSYAGDLETLKLQREIAERRLDAYKMEMAKYRSDIDRLKQLYESTPEREKRIGQIEIPHFAVEPAQRAQQTELDWLARILASCEDDGISFPPRLLHAFHAAAKASDMSFLTVLAGTSGTGKSLLPKLYAHYGGLLYYRIAVQQNWDSPQDLFGFFNYGEGQFNAKPLLQAMAQMSRSGDDRDGLSDQLLLVLLDEMNLAHIELYFSDLLSALEERRGQDAISIPIDLGSGLIKHELPLGRNVLWCGTLNDDETTKTLSDKVLDRSNVLTFPRPLQFKRRKSDRRKPAAKRLSIETWNGWLDKKCVFDKDKDNEILPCKAAVEEINRHMAEVGKGLGHRVWQSIEAYMAHYPSVVAAKTQEERAPQLVKAFEDQLVMKVMPKLRGIETEGHAKDALGAIGDVIRKLTPRLGKDFDHACRAGHGFFLWSSACYLDDAPDSASTTT
jgi:hypothetical protein